MVFAEILLFSFLYLIKLMDLSELSLLFLIAGLFFHVVGEGVVNLASKTEAVTDKENYIDFRLRLLGEPGMQVTPINTVQPRLSC